ncbi:hypothetical protein ACJMK2_027936 [Sinanodonta woodiana]|uniref:CARD domain-containing protein n=1 Tax=Sinanodonta woodiana TaxID=1069815 RepID=A0ABD3X5H7_SINWO
MDEDHRTVLKKNFGQLQDIIFTSDFLGKLHQYNVLPDDWIELVKCQTTESEKRYKLATLLPKSGPDAFDRFVLALGEQYWWIADKLQSDLQELKTSNTSQTDSTIYKENGIQCDLYSAESENINQEKFQSLYDKIQSLLHLTNFKLNNKAETDLSHNPGTVTFKCLEEGMNGVIQQANQLKMNIDLCYKITGGSGEELHVLLQEKEDKMKHQCKDFESKIREKEMENQNLRKRISELDSEILRFKYEMALQKKEIIDLKQTLQTNAYQREKHKTLDELKRIVAFQKCNPDLGDGHVSTYSPINTNNDEEKYSGPSRSLGKSQTGSNAISIDELSRIHRWMENLHQLLQCEMRQEMQVDSNMDCSQISRDTIETAICNLLEKNKQLEKKIEEYEQQKLTEVIPSGKKVGCKGNQTTCALDPMLFNLIEQSNRSNFHFNYRCILKDKAYYWGKLEVQKKQQNEV